MTPQAWILLIALVLVICGCYSLERENRKLRAALKKKRSRYAAHHYQQIH